MDINGGFGGSNWVVKYISLAEMPEVIYCRFTPLSWSPLISTDPALDVNEVWSYLLKDEGEDEVWDFCVTQNGLPTFLPSGSSIDQYGGTSTVFLEDNYRLWGIYPQGCISSHCNPPSDGPFHYHYFDVYYRRMPSEQTAFIPHQGGQGGGAGANWRWPEPIEIQGEDFVKWSPFPAIWDNLVLGSGWVASDWFRKFEAQCHVEINPVYLGMMFTQVSDFFMWVWPDWWTYKFVYTAMYNDSWLLFAENIMSYFFYDEGLSLYRMTGATVPDQRQAYIDARNLMLSLIPPEKYDGDMGLFDRLMWWGNKNCANLTGFLDDVYHPQTWDFYFTARWFEAEMPETATIITRPGVKVAQPPFMSVFWGLRWLLEGEQKD